MKKNTCIIAEVAQSHDGSLGLLHSYIDAIATTGVDAIKFQTHIAEAESSIHEPFRTKFSYEDKTRYDYWKRMEFSLKQWKEIREHCIEKGLEFISSPFSCKAVDLLEEVGVDRYKVGSGEITNFLLLEKLCKTGKEVILSSGMSSYSEIDSALKIIRQKKSLLQCTTKYPTNAEDIGLNVISEMKNRYNIPIGFSDHSGTIYPALAAVSLGAEIIEIHVVFDKLMFGPDSLSSVTISDLKILVNGIRFIDKALNSSIDKNSNDEFLNVKNIFEKTLCVNKNLPENHIITFDDLEGKKPSNMGIPSSKYKDIIGKKLNRAISRWEFLNYNDLSI